MKYIYIFILTIPHVVSAMFYAQDEIIENYFDAVNKQMYHEVKQLIDLNPFIIFARDSNEQTALMYAARTGDEVMIRLFLKTYNKLTNRKHRKISNELLIATDKNGRTALYNAAFNGHTHLLTLLNAGNIINLPDQLLWSPPQGFEDLKPLLNTPLMYATLRHHADTVRKLLLMKADPNIANNSGRTPLSVAAEMGFDEIIDDLMNHGTNIDHTDNVGRTPLILSIMHDRLTTCKKLLAYHPSRTIRDVYKNDAYTYASQRDPQFRAALDNSQ